MTAVTRPAPRVEVVECIVRRLAGLLFVIVVVPGCNGTGEPFEASPPSIPAPTEVVSPPREVAEGPLVIFLGDSLSAGYGLSEELAFPRLLADRLQAAGLPVRLVNAGVSGDTSVGGRQRLDWLLSQEPDVVVVELGANDGLRGLPLEMTRSSLAEILRRVEEAGSRSLLLGMMVPPNYGPEYSQGFAEIFPSLAEETGTLLVPFLLDGVGGQPELNLGDGIHPTAQGHEILADNVYPYLKAIVQEL